MKRSLKYVIAGLSGLSAATLQTPLSAQDSVIQEIIVTATQRERSAQEIPVSVNMLSADKLEKAGVTDIQTLTNVAPSFYLTSTSSETGGTTARVRGVGTQGNNAGLESAVGMFIDGVYRNRSAVGFTDLGQVERIEVLRGPQGTLFGRNTSAGLISVHTKKPEVGVNQGYAKMTLDDKYKLLSMQAGASGSSDSETVALGADITYTERDGFFEDRASGEDYNTRNRYAIKGQMVLEPNADVTMRTILDYGNRDEACCASVFIEKGARTTVAVENLSPLTLTSDENDPFARESFTTPGRSLDTEVREWGISHQIDYAVNDKSTLTSITAFRDWDTSNAVDADVTAADILYRDLDDEIQHFQTISQELRYNVQAGDFDLLFGAYYSDENLDTTLSNKLGSDYKQFADNLLGVLAGAPGPIATPFTADEGNGADDSFSVDSTTYAVFTHNTWNIADTFELALGIRATREEKDFLGSINTIGTTCSQALTATGFAGDGSPFGGPFGALTPAVLAVYCLGGTLNSTLDGIYSDDREEDNVSGIFSASLFVSDDLMLYGSYSRGYKSGGYNLDRSGLDPDTVLNGISPTFGVNTDVEALEFEDETVDSYELGFKSTFANGKLRLNTTLFYQDFEDFQLNTFNGLTFFVVTLNEVNSQGAEVDINYLPIESLQLNVGAMYNDAQYDDQLERSDGLDASNLAGQNLTHAPRVSATSSATYSFAIGTLDAFAHLDLRYMGEHNTGSDLDPEKEQQDFTVINARFGIGSEDNGWNMDFWIQNLTDEEYIQVAFDTPLQNSSGDQALESYSAFLGNPRTMGGTVGYKF